ncbi:MAG: hypothetical protein M1823_007079, partial [Watsoniomyces obsoletus]
KHGKDGKREDDDPQPVIGDRQAAKLERAGHPGRVADFAVGRPEQGADALLQDERDAPGGEQRFQRPAVEPADDAALDYQPRRPGHQDQDKNCQSTQSLAESFLHEFKPTPRDQTVDQHLSSIYPPIPTPLSELSHLERSAILNAILLLLLSLESYRAHSRTLLLRLCTSLHISAAELTKMEKDTALGLLKIADASAKDTGMDASASTAKAQQSSSTSRKWKVGVAGVAGAALIGITGGLAAPLLAAGVGTLMCGLGLGATAA